MGALTAYFFKSCFGWLGVAASARGVVLLTRPSATNAEVERSLRTLSADSLAFGQAVPAVNLKELGEKVAAYLAGARVEFKELVDLSELSEFRRDVLEVVRTIPYGEVVSYNWVATHVGRPSAARAVGHALHCNPVPIIIPCHRVIGSDGHLHGFRWGLEWKARLLRLEKAATRLPR